MSRGLKVCDLGGVGQGECGFGVGGYWGGEGVSRTFFFFPLGFLHHYFGPEMGVDADLQNLKASLFFSITFLSFLFSLFFFCHLFG